MSELIIPPNLTERLARLAELEAQATPGEWFACPPDEDGTLWVETDYDGGYPVCGLDSTRPGDAALIAEMRNALPELLAEIERLHAVIRDGQGAQVAAVDDARAEFINAMRRLVWKEDMFRRDGFQTPSLALFESISNALSAYDTAALSATRDGAGEGSGTQ